MNPGTRFLRNFIVALFLGSSLGLELQVEESTLPRQLTAVVTLGKPLRITVGGNKWGYQWDRWLVNGTSVLALGKCKVTRTIASSSLICSDMDWSDKGLYEHQVITRSSLSKILLAVKVIVAECSESVKEDVKLVGNLTRGSEKCFCSGISEKCEMADNLFRSKIETSFLASKLEILRRRKDGGLLPLKYYSLPENLKGNLLKSYGGFLDIPPMHDGIDPSSPDVMLKGNDLTLVYHHKRALEISGELIRKRILMTEQDWRHLNGSDVLRDTFKTVLSDVREFRVKNPHPKTTLDSLQIVLDSADSVDRGMGKVTTVEKCECPVAYTGLSCESCTPGDIRDHKTKTCTPFRKWADTVLPTLLHGE